MYKIYKAGQQKRKQEREKCKLQALLGTHPAKASSSTKPADMTCRVNGQIIMRPRTQHGLRLHLFATLDSNLPQRQVQVLIVQHCGNKSSKLRFQRTSKNKVLNQGMDSKEQLRLTFFPGRKKQLSGVLASLCLRFVCLGKHGFGRSSL